MRDRLIELLGDFPTYGGTLKEKWWGEAVERLADHLLENGVIVADTAAVSMENRPLISQCLGRPLDEIIELVQAKEEGRIIVPPCKVGDTVYQTDGVRIYESAITEMIIVHDNIIYSTDGIAFDETAIGCSIFLAREEVEKALAKGESNEE